MPTLPSIHRARSKLRSPRPRAAAAVPRHCAATTLAAPEQPKIQMRINAANVAGCIMILLLMMMRTQKPTPTQVVQQIWKATIKY
jgi:fluoride ion exporter CrcB/FEX